MNFPEQQRVILGIGFINSECDHITLPLSFYQWRMQSQFRSLKLLLEKLRYPQSFLMQWLWPGR